jgi:hypothetical protein
MMTRLRGGLRREAIEAADARADARFVIAETVDHLADAIGGGELLNAVVVVDVLGQHRLDFAGKFIGGGLVTFADQASAHG